MAHADTRSVWIVEVKHDKFGWRADFGSVYERRKAARDDAARTRLYLPGIRVRVVKYTPAG